MITAPSDWNAANALLAKTPIYLMAIAGQPVNYTTHNLAAMGVTGTLPIYSVWLKTPQGASQTIDVQTGSSSIGELELEVVDMDGSIRTLCGGTTLAGTKVTLSVGYPGIAITSFVPLHTYTIYKVNPSKDYTSWIFTARDQQMVTKRTIWYHPENGEAIADTNPWILQGTPCEIAQAVWLFALGIPLSAVDRATLLTLDSDAQGLYNASRPFQFILTEAVDADQFLENEIFKASGLYPVVTNTGQLSLRASRPPAAGPTGLFTFTEDNMIVLPELDRLDIYNEIIVNFDYDGSNYNSQVVYIEADSVSAFGIAGQLTIDSQGLRTAFGAEWFIEDMANRYFRRFAGTPAGLRGGAPTIKIQAFLATLPVWVGDYVLVTHPLMPNVLTGALGVTNELYEVIDREPHYTDGHMEYTLMDTGLTGSPAASQFSPAAGGGTAAIIGTSLIF